MSSLLAVAGLIFTSCNNEELDPGIDKSLPGTEGLTYDEVNSSSKVLAFAWNSDKAIAAGAKSFTLQLTKSLTLGGDIYDSGTSQTFVIKDGQINDATMFSNLNEGNRYYARGRANYVDGKTSDWTYVLKPDTNEPAVLKVGVGYFDGPISTVTQASAILVRATSSTLTFGMSSTDFSDQSTDVGRSYNAQLFKDKDCKDLLVSWILGPTTGMNWTNYTACNFIFSGLSPETTYYFKVIDNTDPDPLTSEVVSATTLAFKNVELGAAGSANAGDIILAEDFSQFIWGGSFLDDEYAAGYSANNRSTVTKMEPALGENPVADSYYNRYICKVAQNMGLFNTLDDAVPETRLKTWGYLNEANSAGALCALAGHVQLGASSKCAEIVTPELSSLKEAATLEITFDAQTEDTDLRHAIVEVINNATVEKYCVTVAASDRVAVEKFEVDEAHKMREYKITATNVLPTSRIAIGGDVEFRTSGQERIIMDNLKIKVVSYGKTAVKIATPVISKVTAGSDNIVAEWAAAENAAAYQVEYKKSSDSEWLVSGSTSELSYKVTGLDELTAYDVRVKGVSGEYSSDYSASSSATTIAAPKEVSQKLVRATATQIMVQWSVTNYKTPGDDLSDYYQFGIYSDEACSNVLTLWKGKDGVGYKGSSISWSKGDGGEFDVSPVFQFPGLTPATDYWVKITDVTKDISSVAKYSTEKSQIVDIAKLTAGSAKAGQTILFEDFGEFLWGGSSVEKAGGFSTQNRTTATSITNATGSCEYTTTEKADDYYMVAPSLHMGLFNTLAKSIGTTRLDNWAYWAEAESAGAVCIQSGNMKIGASKYTGCIVTPTMSALSGTATVKVTFKASPYVESTGNVLDNLGAQVSIYGGSAVANHNIPYATEATHTESIELDKTYGWKEYTVTISGVKPTDVIAIGGRRTDGAENIKKTQQRLYVDDIKVEVVKYE